MPVVTKQNHKAPAVNPAASVLSRIGPIRSTSGVKLNVYGRGKTGKTRLACTFPKPILLIGTEDGTKSVSNVKDVAYIRLQHSSEIEPLAEELKKGKYRTAALDTAGGLQDMILKEVLGLADIPVQKTWGMAQRGDWMIVGTQWKERMRSILSLADKQGLNVVIIAHERNFNEEGDNSDIIVPTVGSALTPTVAGWLNAECDYVCQAFIRQGETVKKITIGQGDKAKVQEVKQKTGKIEYCLRTGPHPTFMTGFRLPIGQILPDVIVDPTYDKINSIITGGK